MIVTEAVPTYQLCLCVCGRGPMHCGFAECLWGLCVHMCALQAAKGSRWLHINYWLSQTHFYLLGNGGHVFSSR